MIPPVTHNYNVLIKALQKLVKKKNRIKERAVRKVTEKVALDGMAGQQGRVCPALSQPPLCSGPTAALPVSSACLDLRY